MKKILLTLLLTLITFTCYASEKNYYYGFDFTFNANNPVVITKLFDNSPMYEAGVNAGDLIISINSEPTKKMTYDYFRHFFEEGQTVVLELKRGRKTLITKVIPIAGTNIEKSKSLDNIDFIPSKHLKSEVFDNALQVTLVSPIIDFSSGEKVEGYYSKDYSNNVGGKVYTGTIYACVNGVNVILENISNNVIVIKMSESALTVGNFSGIPFFEGIKYVDAGKPSATPDLILPPKFQKTMPLYISQVYLESGRYGKWQIKGKIIPKTNDLTLSLTLKIANHENHIKYYSITSNPIGKGNDE